MIASSGKDSNSLAERLAKAERDFALRMENALRVNEQRLDELADCRTLLGEYREARRDLMERNAKLLARLAEAEALIDELNAHEGAEGWSDSLSERLDRFYKKDPVAALAEIFTTDSEPT